MQVKLVDAGFIWTEPHSRRLKTKLTVQSEVFNGAILQQTFVVEYVVETHMCPDCSKAAANPNQWTAVCQVGPHPHHYSSISKGLCAIVLPSLTSAEHTDYNNQVKWLNTAYPSKTGCVS